MKLEEQVQSTALSRGERPKRCGINKHGVKKFVLVLWCGHALLHRMVLHSPQYVTLENVGFCTRYLTGTLNRACYHLVLFWFLMMKFPSFFRLGFVWCNLVLFTESDISAWQRGYTKALCPSWLSEEYVGRTGMSRPVWNCSGTTELHEECL